jgi:hypothetical protein
LIQTFDIRKFKSIGKLEFEALLSTRPPHFFEKLNVLADDDQRTENLGVTFSWDEKWVTREDLAKALWPIFGEGGPLEKEAGDPQVWNWLSCKLFPILNKGGEAQARKNTTESNVRWVMTENKLRQHRHLVSGPFIAYKNNFPNVDNALSQLVQPILSPGEVVERISGKIELCRGPVAELSTWLYVDKFSRQIRPGITGVGEPQALSKWFNQIQRTIDYESMTAKSLLEMMPETFKKWKDLAKDQYKI